MDALFVTKAEILAKPPELEIYRTRLFLITPPDYVTENFAGILTDCLKAGDVASLLILPPANGNYQTAAEILVPIAQEYGVAALLHNDSQIMGRARADGLHLDGPVEEVVTKVKAHSGEKIMGVSGVKTRHEAMEMGEGPIDYLFFGRLDGDTKPDIFPKMFKLAEWWSSMCEVPAVVMGGGTIESVQQAADAGIDFVALKTAIWNSPDPVQAIKAGNILLDAAFEKRLSVSSA